MDSQVDGKNLYEQLYELSDPFNNRAIRLDVLSGYDKNSYYEIYVEKKFKFGIQTGKVSYDIAWTNSVPEVCISSRLIEVLSRNKITGWRVYPIELLDPKKIVTTEYFLFQVEGPNYVLDKSRMQLVYKEPIFEGGKPHYKYKGYYFNDSEYSGKDIFLIRGSIFIKEHVKKILEKEKVRNIRITPILDVEIDKFDFDLE